MLHKKIEIFVFEHPHPAPQSIKQLSRLLNTECRELDYKYCMISKFHIRLLPEHHISSVKLFLYTLCLPIRSMPPEHIDILYLKNQLTLIFVSFKSADLIGLNLYRLIDENCSRKQQKVEMRHDIIGQRKRSIFYVYL